MPDFPTVRRYLTIMDLSPVADFLPVADVLRWLRPFVGSKDIGASRPRYKGNARGGPPAGMLSGQTWTREGGSSSTGGQAGSTPNTAASAPAAGSSGGSSSSATVALGGFASSVEEYSGGTSTGRNVPPGACVCRPVYLPSKCHQNVLHWYCPATQVAAVDEICFIEACVPS